MKPASRPGIVEQAAWALLFLFVFSIPWQKSVWVPGIGTVSRLFGIVAFAACALVAARRGSVRPPNLAMLFAALLVAWSAAGWFWTIDRQATVGRVATLGESFAMLWLVWDACRSAARQRQLMQAYLWGAVAASGIAFIRYLGNQQTYYLRYAAPGFDPNDFGIVLALSIPLALYLSLKASGLMAWLYRVAVVTVMAAVLLTASRSALIASFLGFAFVFWTWRRAGRQQRIAGIVLLALLALGTFVLAPASSRRRLATISSELTSGSLHGRTRIWKTGLKVFKDRFLLGVGSGAFPQAVRPWLGTPGVVGHQYVAHNTFLSVLVELGVIGFGIYALLLGTLVLFIWNMPHTEAALWAVMLAVWAAGVSTLTWEHYKTTWLLFALITTEWARSYRPMEGRK